MSLRAKYSKFAWVARVVVRAQDSTGAVLVVPPVARMPVAAAAGRRIFELEDQPWLTGSQWLQAAVEWAEGTPMQMREMEDVIPVVLAKALLGKAVAERRRFQVELEDLLGLVLGITGAVGAWATVVQVRMTLATT